VTAIEVPTTTIPPAPRHQDQLLKMGIEEQRVLIGATLEELELMEDWYAASTLESHHETLIFPDPPQTDVCIVMVAGAVANTFSDWVEIVDENAASFSSKFAANSGYIVSLINEDFSDADKVYLIEMAYGAAKTVIGRTRMQSGTNKTDTANQERMRALVIPAGETVYYRMASEVESADIYCHIRYYLVPS